MQGDDLTGAGLSGLRWGWVHPVESCLPKGVDFFVKDVLYKERQEDPWSPLPRVRSELNLASTHPLGCGPAIWLRWASISRCLHGANGNSAPRVP